MAGLVPAIHALLRSQDVDARHKATTVRHGLCFHAAFSIAAPVRLARRHWTARVARAPKSKTVCGSGFGGGDLWRSSAIGRRCIRLAWISLAKASGLWTILLASCARRSSRKAMRATAI